MYFLPWRFLVVILKNRGCSAKPQLKDTMISVPFLEALSALIAG